MHNTYTIKEYRHVGNRHAHALDFLDKGLRTVRDNYWIGEPRDSELGTAEELKKRGFVGLYQKYPGHELVEAGNFVKSRWIE